MTREEKAQSLIEEAEGNGLLVNYDSGFLIVSRSASADRRRDDGEDARLITELGKSLKDIFTLEIRRARYSSAKDFIDREVFISGEQLIGRFAGCSEEGIVKVVYRVDDPNRLSNLNTVELGAEEKFFIIVAGNERPDQPSFSWIAEENVRQLFEWAESAGVSLEHDRGFTLVKWRAIGDVDGNATIRRIGKSMREVFAHTVAQARARRGAGLVGQRVFVPEFNAFGVLASSEVDGSLSVSYHDKRTDSDQTCYCAGDGLLVIVAGDEEVARAVSAGPKSAEKNWIRRTFGG